MDDTLFITKLSICKLLPENIESQLKALPTQAAKASYFLEHVIKPTLDTASIYSFDNLLSVMECSGCGITEKLACEIKSEFHKWDHIESGMIY